MKFQQIQSVKLVKQDLIGLAVQYLRAKGIEPLFGGEYTCIVDVFLEKGNPENELEVRFLVNM